MNFKYDWHEFSWSRCPAGLRRGSAAAGLLGLRVRIPPIVVVLCSIR